MDLLKNKNNYFLFETNRFDSNNFRSYYFMDPEKEFRLEKPEDLIPFFDEMDNASKKFYLAGFFSYELGYLMEEAFHKEIYYNNKKPEFPFALFFAYREPVIFDHKIDRFTSGNINISGTGEYKISDLTLNTGEGDYKNNIKKIREYIRQGDIYQANYTMKYKFKFDGSPFGLYRDLVKKQDVSYNVFARFDNTYILSLSPELFYQKDGNKISVKPMKGTMKRGRNLNEDIENSTFLRNDEKNRSENIMIVDLLRNDIGKISTKGSVTVTKLYEIEKYKTLFQMTSTIESTLENNISMFRLIKSIFPSGSVTGAPKIRSMQIIRELEKEDRKVYTGSIGFFEPNGDSRFNVAIRTVLINGDTGEMGVGGGIVYDSTPDGELQECKLKGKFLTEKPGPEFSLIETILYDNGFTYLDEHIERLKESAAYYDFLFNEKEYSARLNEASEKFSSGKYRVRTLLDRNGNIDITYSIIESLPDSYAIKLSGKRTSSNNIFLFHKTTSRDFYNEELKSARENGYFDLVFMNEQGEITEGCVTNFYIKKDGNLITPPVECGLLNGSVRRYLVKNNIAVEKKINSEDLPGAKEVYISNAIIGLQRVERFDT